MLPNGEFATINDGDWTIEDGHTVCRNLGFDSATAVYQDAAQFGAGSGQVYFSRVECSGDEKRLGDCLIIAANNGEGNHNLDVGVSCSSTTTGQADGGEGQSGGGGGRRDGVGEGTGTGKEGTGAVKRSLRARRAVFEINKTKRSMVHNVGTSRTTDRSNVEMDMNFAERYSKTGRPYAKIRGRTNFCFCLLSLTY